MSIRTLIADSLIISSLFILIFIYWPIILIFTPVQNPRIESSYSIEIPKIRAYAPIIANVDPWNKNNYEQALKQGVAQAEGFADFGETGTIFLFAHSSLPPWEMTRANTSFLRLSELENGDEIIIKKFDKTYKYKVSTKREVWPNQVDALTQNQGNQLILQTCTPLGTDFRRLLVYAVPS